MGKGGCIYIYGFFIRVTFMKKQLNSILTLGLVLALFSCNDKESTIAPAPSPAPASTNLKEVYLPVGSITANGYNLMSLRKFNKTNYTDLDSIVLAGTVQSQENVTYRIAELVNVSDNEVLASFAIDVSSPSYTLIQSGNIMNELPAREVTLGVRIQTDKGIEDSSGSQFYLYLYRKAAAPVNISK